MMALHPRPRVELPGLGLRSRASVRCLIRSRYTAVVKEDCKTGPVCVFWFLPGIVEFCCLGGPRGLRNHSRRWGAKHPTCLKGFPGPNGGSRGGGNPLGSGGRATSEVGGSRDGAPVTEAGGLGQGWGSCLLEHACWGSRTLGQV